MKKDSPLKKIAGYEVERIIGQGNFARVYAVKNTLDLRQPRRALLELIVQGDNEERRLRRQTFKRTAEILEKLSHSSIPKVYSLFENQGKLYLVQEFIDGINYAEYLDGKNPPLSVSQIEKVFWSVLDGLAQLHRAKIVHRDIKPSNLMRRQLDNSTVIIDFGSACDLSKLDALETTIDNGDQQLGHTRIYTPGYAHPEQQDGLATATAQWDLYALAKTVIALRFGKNPPWNQPLSMIENLGFSPQMMTLLPEMLKTQGCQLIDAYDAIKFESELTKPVIAANPAVTSRTVSSSRRKNSRKNRGWLIFGILATALATVATGIYFFLPEYTSGLLEKVQLPFVPQCPNYVKNDLRLPVPDRGFAARFYYPEDVVTGDSTLEILQQGNLIAQATDDVKGFIWIKSLADGSNFPPGNYKIRLTVPESLPYEQEVSLDPDFPVYYLGNAAAVEVVCALNAKTQTSQ